MIAVVTMAMAFGGFCGCTTDSDESVPDLVPDSGLDFWIYPNDAAQNDSASRDLTRGLVLEVHANATYSLSFDADTAAGAPRLLLYRANLLENQASLKLKRVRVLTPTLEGNRYVFNFLCEERNSAEWVSVLEKNGAFYKGATHNVRFEGNGAYSDHMSLNLVVTGNVFSKVKSYTVEDLAQGILQGFRENYTSITIDTIYISYANEHPQYGSIYPANEPWVAGRSDSDVMMQKLGGGWGDARNNALDLVLTHYIDEVGLLGYSYLFSGNMGAGEGSTVVLGAFVKAPMGQQENTMQSIVETAVHESGHFFGLRHTTATQDDMLAGGDYSSVEDGLTDTPYCKELQEYGLMKKAASDGIQLPQRGLSGRTPLAKRDFEIQDCPDASNLMFPAETGVEYNGLSPQQLELVRKNLMIYPH